MLCYEKKLKENQGIYFYIDSDVYTFFKPAHTIYSLL